MARVESTDRQARRDRLYFETTNPVAVESFEQLEQLDESALQSVAREIGQPAWLWACVLF